MPKLKPNQFYILDWKLITERPILYQTEMVQANLEDLKNQTRRTKGLSLNVDGVPKKNWEYTECYLGVDTKDNLVWMASAKHIPTGQTYGDICPYGMPGDLLWVKETWVEYFDPNVDPFTPVIGFKADNIAFPEKLKPSIHMPKKASRIWVMVEDIRVERVQDISEEDAKAEGIMDFSNPKFKYYEEGSSGFVDYIPSKTRYGKRIIKHHDVFLNPIPSYRSLWISINGQESWDSNPWIWVIKYRILSKTGRPSMDVIENNYLEVAGKEVVCG